MPTIRFAVIVFLLYMLMINHPILSPYGPAVEPVKTEALRPNRCHYGSVKILSAQRPKDLSLHGPELYVN
jgi:hypothetical protein